MSTSYLPRVLSVVGAATLTFILVATPVIAKDGHMGSPEPEHMEMEQETEHPTQLKQEDAGRRVEAVNTAIASKAAELKLRIEDRKQIRQERLAGAKLKACQNRQSSIEKHTANATTMAGRVETKFASIAAKVDAFKVAKNITVDNYAALQTDVATKKAAVDAALADAQSQIKDFSCTSEGPKAQLQLFVSQMDVVRQALKDYRTSIKNLIQGVRQANGQNRQATSSANNEGAQ